MPQADPCNDPLHHLGEAVEALGVLGCGSSAGELHEVGGNSESGHRRRAPAAF
jgi:hypothetical protein